MKLNRRAGSQPRRAGASGSDGLQPKLFDVQPAPADQPNVAPVPHLQQLGESNPVDLSGATEYGLGPAQLPLFEAMEPIQEGEGAKAVDREEDAPREGEGDPASGRQQDAQQEPEDAPDAFLKLVARIALRAGQKPPSSSEEVTNEGRIVPESEQRGAG